MRAIGRTDGVSHEGAPDHKGQVHGGQHRGNLYPAPSRGVLEIRNQKLLLSACPHKKGSGDASSVSTGGGEVPSGSREAFASRGKVFFNESISKIT